MSNSSYHGGVPSISVEDAIEITELCMIAGRPDRIADFFACRFTPGEVMDRLQAAPVPAARSASAQPAPSILGDPNSGRAR